MENHNVRKIQIEKLIFEELRCIIPYEMSDPRVVNIEITKVILSEDLKRAKVYFISRCENNHFLEEEVLNKASGFVRFEIGKSIQLKYIPTLSFFLDKELQEEINYE